MLLTFKMLLAICLSLAAASPSSQDTKKQSATEITVCRGKLTSLGKTASFRFNFMYTVKTKDDGTVETVDALSKGGGGKFVREDMLVECMKSWKLKPSTSHLVMFSIGTTSPPDSILINEIHGGSLRLVVP
jgi:hypothetical protein